MGGGWGAMDDSTHVLGASVTFNTEGTEDTETGGGQKGGRDQPQKAQKTQKDGKMGRKGGSLAAFPFVLSAPFAALPPLPVSVVSVSPC